VHSVGKDVYEFKPGDRVAALHQLGKENGSFAEYSVAPDRTTFHIPEHVTFEEAATIPTAALTAAVALYDDMKLPAPQDAAKSAAGNKAPILIYGVTSAVGAFAAKLARLSGLQPIIGIAGRGGDYAKTLVDYVVDYRQGEDAVVTSVEAILQKEGLGSKISHVFDAISEGGTLEATLRFLDPNGGIVSTVLPPKMFAKDKDNFEYPPGVTAINSALPVIHSSRKDFGYLWSRYLGRLLQDGRLKAHPFEVVPGGLHGVLTGLQKLRDGEASAVKYVYRIEDTGDLPPPPRAVPSKQSPVEPHPMASFPFPS
jgi:NADPH:quinone reductase-like Zn-dependent oxidoreductase